MAKEDQNQAENQVLETPEVPETQEVTQDSPNLIRISDQINDKAKWYIIHTYSGHENKVAEALRQRAESLGLTAYIFPL